MGATLNVPWNGVNAPPPVSPVVAPLDFSKIASDYYGGQQQQHQLAIQNAFRGGLPLDANGNPDFQAAALKLIQLGAPEQATQLMNAGINQQAFAAARQELGQPLGGSSAGAAASPVQNTPAPQTGDYYSINHALESGGNPAAHNPDAGVPGTAAYGLAGFMPQTWAHLVQAHPELGLPADITKSTAAQQEAASRALTGENAGFMAQNGVPVTDRTARMANFLGGAGAVHFFTSLAQNPAAPAASLFPKEAAANPDAFYLPDGKTPRTLAQVLQYETVILPKLRGLPPLGPGNTTGFNFQPVLRNQVAGPGAPSGQPTQNAPMEAPAGVYRNPAANAFAGELAAQAAASGGTVPGGAASPGSPAATNAARIAQAAVPTTGASFGALGEPAQGDASLPPSQQSSYAQNLAKPPPTNPGPSQQGSPAPVATQPPPAAQPRPGPSVAPTNRIGLMDPSLAGLVPQGWDPGAYASALYRRAGILSLSPATKAMGDAYKDQADKVMAAVTASVTSRSPALQEYQLNAQQKPDGTWETPGETQARIAGATETTKAQAKNEQTLEKVQPTPGGPVQFDTTAHLLQAVKDGRAGANSSVGPGAGSPPGGGGVPSNLPVAEQPAFIAQRQDQIAKDENTMMQQFQARQIAKERLGELANLTETFETGDLAGAKAKAQALAAAWGIPIPNTATMNAAAFEQFTKNAVANVFDNVKSMGGRVLVSEIAGLSKANANPEMQPGANAKIIAQGAGILNYEDQHTQDYFDWKHQNPNAYDTSGFEIPWVKGHPVRTYTEDASKQMAPLGAVTPIPKSPADLAPGTYRFPNKPGVWNWDGKQFTPEARPASERLFPKVSVTNG